LIANVAGTLTNAGGNAAGSATNQDATAGHLITCDISHTLLGKSNPSQCATKETYVSHALRAEGFDASENGTGRGTPLVPIAFSSKDHGADAQSDCAPTLRAMGHADSHANAGGQVAIAFPENRGDDAYAYKADASSALSTLREIVGTEAYGDWGIGILAALQSPQVLQSWLHGKSLRSATEESRPKLDDSALSRAENSPGRTLFHLWFDGPDGRSSQGRGLAKQLAGKPGEALSVLPHEGASQQREMPALRQAYEGARVLRQALSAVQEVRRPTTGQGEPAHTTWAVRRLTPLEAERLQGFPDGWTQVPYRGKPAADGPRYKALGNSMAVNVMRWIGRRIDIVEALP
jgi:DNA (cytosine-5)-methyltransferase 1